MPLLISSFTPLRPLRMNPPTPTYPSKHYYLAISGNIGEALGPLRCRPYKALSPPLSGSVLPDMTLHPDTMTIFGSSRQRSKSPELENEQEKEVGLDKNDKAHFESSTAQSVTPAYNNPNKSNAQTLAKLCSLPPATKPPQKPLPPLPSSRTEVPRPACHVPWISPVPLPGVESSSSPKQTADHDSTIKQPATQSPAQLAPPQTPDEPTASVVIEATPRALTTSTFPSLNDAPASPGLNRDLDSPILRPATKRTPATYENAVRAAAGSTFRHSMSSFHGKVFEQHDDDDENENDCGCDRLPIRGPFRAAVRWLRGMLVFSKGEKTKSKMKHDVDGYKLHSLTRKQRHKIPQQPARTNTTATTSSFRSKHFAAEDLQWQTNVTTRFAGEGRWLPVPISPTTSSYYNKPAPRRSTSHMSKTSTLLHTRAASIRTKPVPLTLTPKPSHTSTPTYQPYAYSINQQNSLLLDIDRMAQLQAQWSRSGKRNRTGAHMELEREYVIEQWKARRRSEYRGVERTEVSGWEGMGRIGVL